MHLTHRHPAETGPVTQHLCKAAAYKLLALSAALLLIAPAAAVAATTTGYNQTPPPPKTETTTTNYKQTPTTPKKEVAPKEEKEAPAKSEPSHEVGPSSSMTSPSSTTSRAHAGRLPFTGLDLRWLIVGGVLLVGSGLSIVVAQRARHRAGR